MIVKNIYPENPFCGFGDYLRGCLSLRSLCLKYGFTVELDYSHHMIGKYLRNQYCTPIQYNDSHILSLNFTDIRRALDLFQQISQISEGCLLLSTNLWCLENGVSDETREFMKQSLSPTLEFQTELSQLQTSLGITPGEYTVLHIRMGDEYLLSGLRSEEVFESVHAKILKGLMENGIESFSTPILVLSDSYELKVFLNKKEGWKISPSRPCHLGADAKSLAVRQTLLDFFLITQASSVYCLSNHGYGSGFCDWACDIYSVPCVRFANEEAEKEWKITQV